MRLQLGAIEHESEKFSLCFYISSSAQSQLYVSSLLRKETW